MSEILRTSIGKRLAAERQRLDMTQAQLAEAAGVSRRAVISWEQGGQTPNAEFLASASEKGLDVLFIVTGVYQLAGDGKALATGLQLSADEQALLVCFRSIDDKARSVVKDLLCLLAGSG